MDKAEKVAVNHTKLTSALFHLKAAYEQIGDSYDTSEVYDAIDKAYYLAAKRLASNETSTS